MLVRLPLSFSHSLSLARSLVLCSAFNVSESTRRIMRAEFQRGMERYWCLRWIEQERVDALDATVVRDNLVRLDRLPLVIRVPSLRQATAGEKVRISLSKLDFWELSVHAEHVAGPPADGQISA